jgi:membrane-associated phospholipid phosphatase
MSSPDSAIITTNSPFSSLWDRILEWDKRIVLKWNLALNESGYVKLIKSISVFLGPWQIYFVGMVLLIYALITNNFYPLGSFYGVITFGLIFFLSLKYSVRRMRPFIQDIRVKQLDKLTGKKGFPSGHAYYFTIIMIFLWMYLQLAEGYVFLFVAISILSSLFRIMLGVHYPTDIIVGHLLAPVTVLVYFPFIDSYWIGFWELVFF